MIYLANFHISYSNQRRIIVVRLNPLVAQGLDVIYCGTSATEEEEEEKATATMAMEAAAIVCGLSLRDEMAQKVEAKN